MFNIDARREVATLMESEHHSEMKIQAAEYNRDLDDYDFAHGIN
jgi:hypothetical protein